MKFRILIATDVAARGIDVPHIEHVINYDLPQMAEDFIHRIGRTARAGSKGIALSFVTKGDFAKWREIQKILRQNNIKFTHSGINSSKLCFDKYRAKKIITKNKILTPKFIEYFFNESNSQIIKEIEKKLKFPVVIKPINEGSSVGVYICYKNNVLFNI